MSKFPGNLFSPALSPTDGLSQSQREAIVDLLHYCMCADKELFPCEVDAFQDEIERFNWDPGVDFEPYAARSLEQAHGAVSSDELRQKALSSIASRLATDEAKSQALALCPQIFLADGHFAQEERAIFVEIKRAFGWQT